MKTHCHDCYIHPVAKIPKKLAVFAYAIAQLARVDEI